MKKLFVFLVFIAFAGNQTMSQNPIPNPSFEMWTNDNSPNSWYGLTLDLMIIQYHTLSKTTDAQAGAFAAKIETLSIPLLGSIPGIACLSPMNLNLLGGGLQFTTAGAAISVRPTKVLGYFKYNSVNGDTAMVAGIFTKWNTATNKRDTLGIGGFMVNTVVGSYTPFQFTVNLSQTPDSMNILLISSAGYSPQAGSTLFIDNLSMEYTSTAGVESMSLSESTVYPNPAFDEVLLALPSEGNSVVRVYDMTGKLVLASNETQKQFFLDVRSLNSGVYLVVIEQNNAIYKHKININR